jgi:hypothetical protein
MKWTHESVFAVLYGSPDFGKTRGHKQQYVCITKKPTQEAGNNHSMILYSPKDQPNKPYHYRKDNRKSFDHRLHESLKPTIGEKKKDTNSFYRCEIKEKEWDRFAKIIGLEDVELLKKTVNELETLKGVAIESVVEELRSSFKLKRRNQ